MDIEVIEFYPTKQTENEIIGSMHIYIIDLGIDLRGIHVVRKGKFWRIDMPSRFGIDEDTKQEVRFPVFSFSDLKKNKELRDLIVLKGKEYIEKNFMKVVPK